jgi:hypothetical protein
LQPNRRSRQAGITLACARSATVAVLVLVLAVLPSGQCQDAAAKVKDEKLRRELLDRRDQDQQARKRLVELLARQGGKDAGAIKAEIELATKKVQEIDRASTARMKEIVDRHGWPGKSLVGSDGAEVAWLLVQHADADRLFQKRCLPLLVQAVKLGEASAQHMAYLTDRVRVADKEKQVYGTQFRQVGSKVEPFPIEDEANVDARRRAVGLATLAVYRKQIEAMLQAKDKKAK